MRVLHRLAVIERSRYYGLEFEKTNRDHHAARASYPAWLRRWTDLNHYGTPDGLDSISVWRKPWSGWVSVVNGELTVIRGSRGETKSSGCELGYVTRKRRQLSALAAAGLSRNGHPRTIRHPNEPMCCQRILAE